jgi:hypothetical protein
MKIPGARAQGYFLAEKKEFTVAKTNKEKQKS